MVTSIMSNNFKFVINKWPSLDFLKLSSSIIANTMQVGIKGKIKFVDIFFVQTEKSDFSIMEKIA